MKNIERILEEIIIADVEPDEEIIRKTKLECRKIEKETRQAELDMRVKKSKLTVRLLAAASFVAFVFFALIVATIGNQNPMKGSAYYTIDINPSFGFTVDENNIVLDVTLQNDDAKKLYEGLDCVGMNFLDAVKLIVEKAMANGYIEEEGRTYVLLGQFLSNASNEDGEEILRNLLASLQSELGDNIQLIGVNGDEDDIEQAKKLEVSPGILILCNMSDGVEPNSDVKVEDVVGHVQDYISAPQFEAPVIEGREKDGKLIISWSEIDFSKVTDRNSAVEYKLLKGATLDEIKEMKNVVSTFKVSLEDEQPTEFAVDITAADLNKKIFYSVYVSCGGTSKFSNVLPVTIKSEDINATTEPTKEPDIGDEGASTISGGSISDGKITFSWTGIDSDRFDGYKVMYSYTDSTPVYGEEGCYYLEYITDENKTTGTYKLTSLTGYKEGRKFYFSITALYDSQQTKVAGNVIAKVMPVTTTVTPAPTNDYASTTIRGEMDGGKIYLNWDKISDDRFEGYKVVYSFTDSTPAYSSSPYLRWITDASQTSTTINISELGTLDAAAKCYFSITALYDGQAVKMPGNAISFMIPATVDPEPLITPTLYSVTSSSTDGYVYMSWSGDAASHSQFSYFKVIYQIDGETRTINVDAAVSWSKLAASLDGYVEGTTTSGTFSVAAVYTTGEIKTSGSQTVNLYSPPA